MVNGSRFYRALEIVSIASALSTALYHLPMPDRSPSTLTTPTSYSSEGLVAGHSGQFTPNGYLSTMRHSGNRSYNLPSVSPTRYQ